MCGIFALHRPDASAAELRRDLVAMARRLAHRGRDASGVALIPRDGAAERRAGARFWTGRGGTRIPDAPPDCDGATGFLGHHRLAIVDTDDRSAQPLVDEATGVALAMNGEVYNYLELRAELAGRGHRFRTRGDGEVALRSYVEWGPACVERFVGDFALAVVDHRRRRLVAARDRLGAKPLFAWRAGTVLALSSEIKGLLDLHGFAPRLDDAVAARYLAAEFPTEQTLERSFVRGVEPIPAACWVEWTLGPAGASPPRTHRYWRLDDAVAAAPAPPAFSAAVARVDALLADAVRIRLRCDVPTGGLLSGGLDSPLVAWHAVREGGPLPTFTAVFPGHDDDDEAAAAAAVAACLGVPNEQMVIDDALDVDLLADAVYEQDEPFTTLNVVAQSALLRRAAARGVRVIFDGGGADELFGGYDDYRIPAAADRGGRSMPEAARRLRGRSGPALARWHAEHERAQRRVPWLTDDARRAAGREPGDVDRPLDPHYGGTWRGSHLRHALRRSVESAWMNKSVQWDARSIDRAGMRWGIEARCPFMDHRLVEAALALPPPHLVRGPWTKLPLRRAMRGRLPETVRRNPRKIGFRVPLCAMLRRDGPLRDALRGLAADPALELGGLVDAGAVRRELAAVEAGASHDYNIWRPFNLCLWARAYLSPAPPPVLAASGAP